MKTTSAPNEPKPNQSQVAPRESGASSITPAVAAPESHHIKMSRDWWACRGRLLPHSKASQRPVLECSVCQTLFIAQPASYENSGRTRPHHQHSLAWTRLLTLPTPAPRAATTGRFEDPAARTRRVGLVEHHAQAIQAALPGAVQHHHQRGLRRRAVAGRHKQVAVPPAARQAQAHDACRRCGVGGCCSLHDIRALLLARITWLRGTAALLN